MKTAETAETTYTELLAAILRARERLGCNLALRIRGNRCAVILNVPRTGGPGFFAIRVHALSAQPPELAARMVDRLEPVHIGRMLQVACSVAQNREQHETFTKNLIAYRTFTGLPA